ncbi:hypothetical protein FE257_009199 [Aspergillus nanangensis]|uniref:DNA repair protein Rad4 n=1 Tax=Aspergillus nanangensis TaxID=2582783 RepID=A0AAD4CKH7_ASPNN|nr:hypothetical protein FE257_009199 [Aspergillus nanangensis]
MPRTPYARPKRERLSRRRPPRATDDEIPEVYQEMLAEAEARDPRSADLDHPIKKRKIKEQSDNTTTKHMAPNISTPVEDVGRQVQIVYDSPSSEESDMEWEEVDIQPTLPNLTESVSAPVEGDETLQITLDSHEGQKRKAISRRKPITAAERKIRLDTHKVHLLCLLRHVQIRNLWCNDEEVQKFLKRMLTKQDISLLNPSEDKPQYARSTTFVEGLQHASEAFMKRFGITKPGLRRPHWSDDSQSLKQKTEFIMSDAEVFLSKEDFQLQAKTLHGSRDFGIQLFCALLRSAAVDTRLVCSLQPLPFSGTTKNAMTTAPTPQSIDLTSEHSEISTDEKSQSTSSPAKSKTRRLGQPQFKPSRPNRTVFVGARPSVRESAYPVFWVEAFNEAVQKWVPVDPLVTKTLAKPFRFEPPSSDPYNCMSYVVAFEEDASVRDVTRRYSKAFNAKTRKLRVESTKNGDKWWIRAMRFYEKPFLEDRDEVEISELTAKSAAEPMPRNVQDFKDHPIYALERHLRRNEVVHPKRTIGQVSLGKSGPKKKALEPVFRRSDVHVLRSANKWYRIGRDVKMGEQPLKRVRASRQAAMVLNEDENEIDSTEETPLYAYFQTELYTPPPIVQGRVPKNAYGNLDVYVPTMVPSGGVYIQHNDAARAARILSLDYADAVTGFDFKGRHGTAIFQGIVIASEYRQAVEEVLQALEYERLQTAEEAKTAEILRLWKQFLLRLRIAQRVNRYVIEGEDSDGNKSESSQFEEPNDDFGGGFIPNPDQKPLSPPSGLCAGGLTGEENLPEPATGGESPPLTEDESAGGGFIPNGGVAARSDSMRLSETEQHDQTGNQSRYTLLVAPKGDIESPTNGKPEPEQEREASTDLPNVEPENTCGSADGGNDSFKGSSDAPKAVGFSTGATSKSDSVEVESRPTDLRAQSVASHSTVGSSKGSETEYEGSLLSHDPEDEDAIPEWLMFD